ESQERVALAKTSSQETIATINAVTQKEIADAKLIGQLLANNGATAKKAAQDTSNGISSATGAMKSFEKEAAAADAKVKQLGSDGEKSGGILKRMLSGAGGLISSALGGIGGGLLSSVTGGMGSLVSEAFKFNETLENSQIAFKTLMGSESAATQHIAEL